MSITTDKYNRISSDISKGEYSSSKYAMRMKILDNGIKIAFAVEVATKMLSAYISISSNIIKNRFPKWKGIEIGISTLPDYCGDKPFVGLIQLPDSADDIFKIVVEDLRSHLENAEKESESLSIISDVLDKWNEFFKRDKELLMSEKMQQGLYGELLFLKEAILNLGSEAVNSWTGGDDETHDFYIGSHAVEVKTTSVQEPYYAYISSEYQLDNCEIPGKLFLRYYAFRKSQNSGEKLNDIISDIRNKLENTPGMLNLFNDKLKKYGYYDEANEYYTIGYYSRDNYYFSVREGFPRIVKTDVPAGVSDLSYKISITQCLPFASDSQSIFRVLRGES